MYKKGLTVGLLILMIGVNMGSTFAGDIEVKDTPPVGFDGNTLYVGGSGPNNYTTIQSAINDASDGDTVFVYDDSSPYNENVVVDKSISLMGEDNDTTIIDGSGIHDVVFISADFVEVSNFKIRNSGDEYGGYPPIFDCGIELLSNHSVIFNNIFYHNKVDILLNFSNNNLILGNNINSTEYEYRGIMLCYSDSNIITNNFIFNGNGGNCGIGVIDSKLNNVTDNIIMNHEIGIQLDSNANDNIVSNNIISNSILDGIWTTGSYRNQIINNKIENNGRDGIRLQGAHDYIIESNFISNNSIRGIQCRGGSRGNLIMGNTIDNSRFGLYSNHDSGDNIIKNNNIRYNNMGIYLKSSNNEISSNNFIMNLKKARAFECSNTWERNYWNRPRLLPKPIITWKIFWIIEPSEYRPGLPVFYPVPEYDMSPRMRPYDIGV
jgi:parallel beta-helix repeat protein